MAKSPTAVAAQTKSRRDAGAAANAEPVYQEELDNQNDLADALAALEVRVAALESA
jgi:hypothetical protein